MSKNLNAGRLLVSFASFALVVAGVSAQTMFRKVNDFDGGGKADLTVTRNEGGLKVWYIWQSTAGYKQVQWGITGDNNSSGDFDGDGRTDIAIARTVDLGTRDTYILQSMTGGLLQKRVSATFAFFSGPQDYDGDGKSDPSVTFTEGVTTLVYNSSLTGNPGGAQMPGGGIARIGDLTGDGRSEVASHSVPTLWIQNLATGQFSNVNWGVLNDQPVLADFDGDSKGDIAIFRPSTGDWWWIRSSDGVVNAAHWGITGDLPVPADYDNDGKTDLAIYRPGSPNGVYWIYGSTIGARADVWGISGDTVVRY